MHDFLKTIYQTTSQRVSHLDLDSLRQQANLARQPHNFLSIFNSQSFSIIAEIKFASPSAGVILDSSDALQVAKEYLHNGAAALSILTEPDFFKGDIAYLQAVRAAFPDAYILMKDFFLSEAQLLQARAAGADAILLIVAFLAEPQLQSLYHQALALDLTPLIEVHTLPELMTALKLNPMLIGINNRNLHDLTIDLKQSSELIKHIPAGIITVSESGLSEISQLHYLQQLGFNGFLMGSHFMKTGQPGAALKSLLHEDKP